GLRQCVQHESGNLLCSAAFLLGTISGCGDALYLNRCADGEGDDEDGRCHRCREHRTIAARELAEGVDDAGWPGEDRLVMQVPLDVEQQIVDGLIAAHRLLL